MPVELQHLRSECGLACLAMVVGCHDRRTDLSALRQRFAGFNQGASLKDLAVIAERLGYLTRGLRTEPQHLRQLQLPAILHWRLDHFVVLVRVARRGCLIHDPAQGRLWCSWHEVDSCFSGIAMELWPAASCNDDSAVHQDVPVFSYAVLWRWAQGIRTQLIWVLLLSLAIQAMVLAAPWHVQWTVDEALLSGDTHLVGVLCLGFGLLLLCHVLTHFLRGLMVLHLGHLLSFQLACQLLKHLLRLPLPWFEHRHLGDITSRFTSLQPIRELLTHGAAAMAVDALMVLLSLGLMLVYSPMLALLVCAVHGLYLIVHLGCVPRMKRLGMGLAVAQAAEQSHLLQSVQAMHNVKIYGLENQRTDHWQQLHSRTLEQSLQLQRQHLGVGTLGLLAGGAELIGLIYLMAHEILAGTFTIGMMYAFLSYRGHFTERLHGFSEQLVSLRTLQVHLQRVGEIWLEPAESPPRLQQEEGEFTTGQQMLSLRQVRFRHIERQPWLLDEVDLDIAPGEFVAFVGPSGCGKSTLLKLLMGLVTPSEGEVIWRGRVLLDEEAASLRTASACVLQGDAFFSGSIVENIALFDVPDLDRVHSCLEQVHMARAVAHLPMGLRTQVGDIGQGLSTGQMQRLLLARALYQQPSYLFLDEATANLDAASAATIQSLISSLRCTRIVVTHDMSFAARADRVFKLQDGQLRQLDAAARSATVQSAG